MLAQLLSTLDLDKILLKRVDRLTLELTIRTKNTRVICPLLFNCSFIRAHAVLIRLSI